MQRPTPGYERYLVFILRSSTVAGFLLYVRGHCDGANAKVRRKALAINFTTKLELLDMDVAPLFASGRVYAVLAAGPCA